jgi:hypothetical protein
MRLRDDVKTEAGRFVVSDVNFANPSDFPPKPLPERLKAGQIDLRNRISASTFYPELSPSTLLVKDQGSRRHYQEA